MWLAAIPVVVLLIGAYLAGRAWRTPQSAPPLRAIPLTSLPGDKRSPSFSVDGNQVAFSWTAPDQKNADVYVQQIGTGAPFRLTSDPADDYSPIWSPDGRSIAFLRRRADPLRHELRLISPLGGSERKVTELQPNGGFLRPITLAWCPDSSCIVVTDSPGESKPDALFAVSVASGEKRQLTDPQAVLGDTDPAMSPDGKWLVFRRDVAPFNGGLYRVALASNLTPTGEPTRLTPTEIYSYNPRWTPDSSEIVFSARGGLWRLGIAGGRPAERLPFVGADGLMPALTTSRPGQPTRLAYVHSFTDTNIWRVETSAPGKPAVSPPAAAISSTRTDNIPNFSPDGSRVVFSSNRSGELEIWVADAKGANATQLTAMSAIPGFPRWSPDGESIAFHSNPNGQGDVLVVSAGGGKVTNLTTNPANDVFPSFSRDGRWIYFSSTRAGQPSIWKIPASGGVAVQVSNHPGLLAIESTDGADLYYVESTVTDQAGPLMRVPVKGGTPVKILDDVISTSFDVLDKGIYYLERVPGDARIRYYEFASRASTIVARDLGDISFGITASRDGRTILYARRDSAVDDLMLVDNFR